MTLSGNALAVVAAVYTVGYVLTLRSLRQPVLFLPYVVVYSVSTVALIGFADGVSLRAYLSERWALFLGMVVSSGVVGHTVLN